MGEEAFHAALDYLVALNIFHYYPTILPDVVFCDTQVLPDKMSELLEYSHTGMLQGSSATTSSVSMTQSHSGGPLTIFLKETLTGICCGNQFND